MQCLGVMTFNLRFANADPSPYSWAERRPATRECIRSARPDLIGTQEGLFRQLRDIQVDSPDYDWIGLGRGGGSRSEFMAIFFRKERLEPLEYDHFWLSDTPNVVGSITWGHENIRMVTWVLFRDRYTGREFYHFNTHLDHANQSAKEKGARLILERLDALNTDLPVILTGDFNSLPKGDRVYGILTEVGGFTDTWYSAREMTGEPYGTWHGYHGPEVNGPRIDWILIRGPVSTVSTGVVTCSADGRYASDHFPLLTTVVL